VPFAQINKIQVHYEIYGAGDPVLMINGLSAPGINWLYQVRDLSPHFQLITFDNRGVGESELPPAEVYPIAVMADDAARLLQHLGVRHAHVVGASMGGAIAQELALRHPDLVRSLVLACTWAKGDGRFVHTVESWVRLTRRLTLEERFRDVLFPMVYSPAFFERPGALKEMMIRVLAYPFPTTPEGMERQARGLLAWNGSRLGNLKRIKAPTLVLVGRDDILTPPAFSRTLARLIPKAKVRIIAGGHGFFIEEAPAFNRAVLAFLRRVK
jgi:pimeloyl-ACP methyl ester carboxylesterase